MFPKKGLKKIKITTADKWFSKYIRVRDIVGGEFCRCITCKKPLHWKFEAQCGHFAKRGEPMTRFHEQNCHAQCAWCNGQNEGEQATHGFAIDKMYGAGTAQKLIHLSKVRGQKPYEKMSLKEIANKYREKFNKLVKEKGIFK